ncbi:hypothetical protein DSO57_1019208 [Entomophthora muscae]|uniref:Uncharacterized protein n=1 Tax=Entomophthora muscae TaxID=34485 RepID=A0ACC2U1V7_9FUNG|nr:hypothetical protein DSO57_1019208 [Entomophthora muscae]
MKVGFMYLLFGVQGLLNFPGTVNQKDDNGRISREPHSICYLEANTYEYEISIAISSIDNGYQCGDCVEVENTARTKKQIARVADFIPGVPEQVSLSPSLGQFLNVEKGQEIRFGLPVDCKTHKLPYAIKDSYTPSAIT